ncbi:MAG: class A beta-lactamase-related serine hydrolase [Gammaproteobacteria bacterium]|nr:class A beta-lactamase-related serine hydrolase [Gammaproteobacteria bacterium]
MDAKTLFSLGFDASRLQRVKHRIETDIAADLYDGAALIVARRGEVALRIVTGFADRASGRHLAADAVFVSFSVGKQFTNALVLNRIERGDLHLAQQVGDILPAFRSRGLREITLFQLLTHTSGILSAIPSVPVETLISIERLADYIGQQRPEAAPGTKVNYSIIAAHSVMAHMVRTVDGGKRSFTQILREDLFEPLGMHDTCLGTRPELLNRLCPIVAKYTEPGMFYPADVTGIGHVLMLDGAEIPAGGYLTTIDDLHRFAQMLARGGELDGTRILSPRTLRYCAQNHTGAKPNELFSYTRDTRGWSPYPANIGIGFFVRGHGVQPGPMSNLSSPTTFCGWGAGSTCFWVDPAEDLSFSFLSSGLLEETYHMERLQRLADLVVTSLID